MQDKLDAQMQNSVLRLLRILADRSQKEIASITGVSQSSVSRAENRKRKLTQREQARLARFFRIDPTVFEKWQGLLRKHDWFEDQDN